MSKQSSTVGRYDGMAADTDTIVEKIEGATRIRLAYYAERPNEISRRLAELDEEWHLERALEVNAAGAGLIGLALGTARGSRFLLLPLLASAFLLQQAMQGRCLPASVLRRIGFRTAREVERERAALKALRGDFERVPREGRAVDRVAEALAATKAGTAQVAAPPTAPSF